MKTLSLGAIMAIFTLLLLLVFMRSKPGIKKMQILKYSLLVLFVFALFALFIFMNDNNAFDNFILLQLVSLALGSVHVWLMYIWFDWSKRESFWPELWFTAFVTALASTIFMFAATFMLSKEELATNSLVVWYCASFIPFLIPYLVLKSFDYLWNIPPNVYNLWHYPMGTDVPDPLSYDLADHMKIIAIELDPRLDSETKNNKVKAPERMELGHFFMSFIEQYNLRNAEETITVEDENQMPYGWLFYLKTKWYKRTKVYDAGMTFNDNNIKENDTIIAERIFY